jgi:hypothetical protein
MAQKSLAEQQAAFEAGASRRQKESDDKARLQNEKATLRSLFATAEDMGLGALLNFAHDKLGTAFESVVPVAGAMAFLGSVSSKQLTILRLLPAKSDKSTGLKYVVSLWRLVQYIGAAKPNERTKVVAAFRLETPNAWPSYQHKWVTGNFQDEGQIIDVANELNWYGFERQQRDLLDDAARFAARHPDEADDPRRQLFGGLPYYLA